MTEQDRIARLADWRIRNPDAMRELGELFRKARGIPPSPQSPVTLTLIAQDVENALAIVFRIARPEEAP